MRTVILNVILAKQNSKRVYQKRSCEFTLFMVGMFCVYIFVCLCFLMIDLTSNSLFCFIFKHHFCLKIIFMLKITSIAHGVV